MEYPQDDIETIITDFYYPNKQILTISKEKLNAENISKMEFLSSQSKFKFGSSFFKFKSIKDEITIPISNRMKKTRASILNPCYQKGYFNSSTNMQGVGNYTNCYKLLSKIMKKDTKGEMSNIEKKSVRLLINIVDNSGTRVSGNFRLS